MEKPTTMKKFIEPILIKAGSTDLGLGLKLTPPMVDCRVLSEEMYQLLKKAYDELENIKKKEQNPAVEFVKWLADKEKDKVICIDEKSLSKKQTVERIKQLKTLNYLK